MSQISSIARGPRQSNFELLRIVAMFMVLAVHADFWALGAPSAEDFSANPANAWLRTVLESVTIVCVNVFVLISGWFGIRFSMRGLTNFVFQCVYFLFGIYIIMLAFGLVTLSIKGIAGCLCLTSSNWFIRAYAALYILSPVLNSFVDKASKRQFAVVLALFFLFQTIWGWSGAAAFVVNGYSAFSFIGLYLLARYTRLYGLPFVTNCGGGIYVLSIIFNSLGYWALKQIGLNIDIYAYCNPIVILGALGLLTWFSKLKIGQSKAINWIAASAFAVFLLHTNPNIGEPIYKNWILTIYNQYSGIECLALIAGFLICFFAAAILFDQPRKWLWQRMTKALPK